MKKLMKKLLRVALALLLHAVPARAFSLPLTRKRFEVGEKIAAGEYGSVHLATWEGKDAVAKCAEGADAELSIAYFKVEREVNNAIRRSGDSEHFARYLGCAKEDADKQSWLVWERLPGPCAELCDYAGAALELEEEHGISLSSVLRKLLKCAKAIHSLGYVHRDVKLENVLLASPSADSSSSSLKLIDMGSAAFVDGCTVIDLALDRCTNIDPDRSPCSPLCTRSRIEHSGRGHFLAHF